MSARPSSPRKPKAEPQLTPDQAAYIDRCLESLVRRGMQTITSTEHVDAQGHTTFVETHRKRTDLPPGQINSWRRLLCKLAESGLLPDKDDPLYYPDETPAEWDMLLPWERQIMGKLKAVTQPSCLQP